MDSDNNALIYGIAAAGIFLILVVAVIIYYLT